MEKTELYYIVTKGTNDRILTTDKHPLIAESNAADRQIDKWCSSGAKISIKDYEAKFNIEDDE